MSDGDREENRARDASREESPDSDADSDATTDTDVGGDESADVPLSDLRRDVERRRGGTPTGTGGAGTQPEDTARGGAADAESAAEPDEEPTATGPLSNLREGVERRRREHREAPPEVDAVFEAATEPVIDGEQVWEELLTGQVDARAGIAFGERVEGEREDVRIIPDRICHNCTYFGDPPEVHCQHEGTEIRRVVDMAHFEVVECPVVKSRSDLAGQ